MDKSTFLCGLTITIWLAFVFDLITNHTAAQIILILFIMFTLVQLGIIKEE